ncbi:Domain of unknown function DUF551 [uncultured Caudovirales phage]|uniref:DUF551 domain-containing protein n=1 Tax=uncultured Caudovirales phage TaxID=2100421 RepID=A0A6J5LZ10_9CAUD|nr:Domain of unknown function DUF551 [uncultured Caudovirales phage]
MDEQQERSAFERWYEGHCLPGEADWFRRDPDEPDEYKHGHTSEAWAGWQARAALAANVPAGFVLVPVEPTPGMVDSGREFDHPKNVWAAMLAAAPVAVASPWMPIETAPKDGSLLLLWERYEAEPFIGHWVSSAYGGKWAASRTHYDTDGNACVIDRFYSEGVTHWQPLPPAPEMKP